MAPSTADRRGDRALWLVVLSPAVVLPGGLDRFVLVSVLAAGAAVLVGLWSPPTGRLPRWALAGIGLGTVLLAVGALTGAAPLSQLLGRWPRYEGLVTLPASAGAFWLGARLLGPSAPSRRLAHLVRATVVLVALVGAIAVLEALGLRPLASTSARPGSLLGNATDQGVLGVLATAVLTAPLVRAVLARGAAPEGPPPKGSPRRLPLLDRPAVQGAAAVLAAATVVLSQSRAAIIGLALVLVLVALAATLAARWSAADARAVRTVLAWSAGAVAALVAATLAVPATAARLLGSSPLAGSTVNGRALLWQETWNLVLDHRWTGVGPSGFVDAIPGYHTVTWALEVGPANPPDSPHNWVLQAGVAAGLPLLMLAVALAVLGVVAGLRRLRAAATVLGGARGGRGSAPTQDADRTALLVSSFAAVVAYGAVTATHVTSPPTMVLAATLAGALVAVEPAAAAVRRWRAAGTVALAAWLGVVATAVSAEWPLNRAYQTLARPEGGAAARADQAFELAQHLRPWDADISMLAAHAFASRALAGDPAAADLATTWSSRALARLPESSIALAASSAGAEMSGDLSAADETMSLLVRREPTNAEWLLRRGVIRAEEGDPDGAERDFLAAAELAPSSPDPWLNLAVLHRSQGDDDAAEAAEREAEQRDG